MYVHKKSDTDPAELATIKRRDVLLGVSGAALAGLVASPALAAQHEQAEHVHDATPKHRDLVLVAQACVGIGSMCLKHCLNLFVTGDTSLSACAARIQEMNAVSEALGVLAAADSAQLKAFIPVCIAVHDACEAECRKHTHHPLCMETAEACAKVTAECKKVLA
ncbi:MAG: hypothetical protein OXC18_23735 [Desulfurellaceae bacterium]|nr:hypothetical protein [Desulfurellaceae bacterium]